MSANVPITETWQRSSWANWDTYQDVTTSASMGRTGTPSLAGQQHIDLRTFNEGPWTGLTQTVWGNRWPAGKAIAFQPGTYLYTSNYTQPIDLTANGPQGLLNLAVTQLPLSYIDPINSTLELSSDGFSQAICVLPWANSTTALISGNCRLTWDYSSLTGIDLTHVNGVRIRVKTSATYTIFFLGLRLLGPQWTQTNVDFDSINGQLRQTVPVDGNAASVSVPSNQVLPPMWRSSLVAGVSDPKPIDAEVSVLFNTGSQTTTNNFTVYMREGDGARITQLDLQGQTQAALTGKPQPSSGVSLLSPRTVGDLDQLTMGQLDAMTMEDLDAVSNPVYSSWISFQVQWGPNPLVYITASHNPTGGYSWSGNNLAITFAPRTTYLAVCNLADTSARLQIYAVTPQLALSTLLFDTSAIPDGSMFHRRPGRIGLQCTLGDGDAYLGAIRPRGLMFAEYRSTPFNSITPVKGARLYADFTPNSQLFTSWSPNTDPLGVAPVVTADQGKFSPLHPDQISTRVTVTTPSNLVPSQGVISNVLTPADDPLGGITNFGETGISFDLWFPSSALNAGGIGGQPVLALSLVSTTGAVIPIPMPRITPDQWQPITLTPPVSRPWPQSGLYQLVVSYQGLASTTFWLDNVEVFQRTLKWSARSVVSDAWQSNYAPWTDFHELVNSDTDGVVLQPRGTQLQMRGQALQMNGAILGPPKLVPVYAELGRLVWADTPQVAGSPIPPTPAFSTTSTGRTYTYNAGSTTSVNAVANYLWAFGDGSFGSGKVASHTYALPGSYAVMLTVYDRTGLNNQVSTIVTVT